MSRKSFVVRAELKEFMEDDKALSPEGFGATARVILEKAFKAVEAGENADEVLNHTIGEFGTLLGMFAYGEKKVYWREFKALYDAGVIKMQSFIEFVMKREGYTHEEAVKYVAKTFGMKESTQSVYLSGEFNLRQKEKEKGRRSEQK